MKHKFRVKNACRIADIDRDRFNEAVAAGNYNCAPPVQRGSTRVFDEDDLIALFAYGRMLEDGYPPKLAGRLACLVRGCLGDANAEEDIIVLFRTSTGMLRAWAGSHQKTPRGKFAGSPVIWRLSFDVANIRKFVRREAEEELSIVGPDDEDE
jgi:hypothetical protein